MRGPKSTATIAQKKTMKKTKAADKSIGKKDKTSSKNSGAPKRPPTAFFVFMEEFRKEYKENFPNNKSVSVVAKEGGVKWKSMSNSEKAPYVAKAATKKAEYGIAMKQHNDDLNGTAKEKSASTSKSSSDTHDDVEQEASS
ncbi:HMG1/2-like protein [Cynara cardunculus var. scolymus]|uniref:HMG1/2-like protein n=1 Tax=Cynara cardunculus var. scolymus TaxID=59895 RepID=UPI000D62389A|nr:HMG1/2-like protein [Cynara cardunculus var. scolymus]